MSGTTERSALTGNEAAALAIRQVAPDVVAAYPITPQTELMQQFAQYVADGEVQTEMVLAESEHSAMSAVVGASAAGVRAMTATSANGLAFMWEMLFIAAGYRLPIVMALVNRSVGGPLNIHGDHSDAMGARDTGWLQVFSENAQEVYDNLIMAVRIAEHPELRLPVIVSQDGFITSHTTQVVEVLPDDEVAAWVGRYRPQRSLSNLAQPMTYGAVAPPDYYMEIKRQQTQAMAEAPRVIAGVADDFAALSGRRYDPFELYRMEEAEVAMVVLGSAAGTAKDAVDVLHADGIRAGLLKLRVFRPFPAVEMADALVGIRAIGVFDRAAAFGAPLSPVASDVAGSLMAARQVPLLVNYIYGLGGRDIVVEDFVEAGEELAQAAIAGAVKAPMRFVGLREE
jgi:pyruvate ferredoxin oxidoreductase alpha subunit